MFEETQGANCDCNDEEPLVEILMATYNGAQYIGEQIDSILNQTYSHWRLLVNDDGSSDGTVDIVKAYAEKDDRIQLLSLENKRHDAAGNFLALLAVSSAPYVMFCDQDDVWLPNKVQLELGAMKDLEREHGADVPLLVFTDSTVVDKSLNVLNPSFASMVPLHPRSLSLSRLMVDNVAQGCVMMINEELVRFLRRYPVRDEFGMHDYWAISIASAVGGVAFLPDCTLLYRQHADNVCGAPKKSLTARGGVAHILRDPTVLQGWLGRLSYDEKIFQRRARAVREELGDVLPAGPNDLLIKLGSFGGMRLHQKMRIVRDEKLLREQKNHYLRFCQFIGMMLGEEADGKS